MGGGCDMGQKLRCLLEMSHRTLHSQVARVLKCTERTEHSRHAARVGCRSQHDRASSIGMRHLRRQEPAKWRAQSVTREAQTCAAGARSPTATSDTDRNSSGSQAASPCWPHHRAIKVYREKPAPGFQVGGCARASRRWPTRIRSATSSTAPLRSQSAFTSSLGLW